MINVNKRSTNHVFEKMNLVTQFERGRQFDIYECLLCGLRGKAYNLVEITVSDRFSKTANNCPKAPKVKKIRITHCNAFGRAFGNLTPGSEHVVIDPPEGKDNSRGVWVMGVGEPVKVLFDEFEEIG